MNIMSIIFMMVAWVELPPQIPTEEHLDCPEAIFSCEAGHITFKNISD
jgi:hypothetical protein